MSTVGVLDRIIDSLNSWRRVIVVVLHLGLIAGCNHVAFVLRFDGELPSLERGLFGATLPGLVVIRGSVFSPFRLYEGLWRDTSIVDLRNVLFAVGASSIGFFGVVHGWLGATKYPRSVFIIDAMLLVCSAGGLRLIRRLYREIRPRGDRKRILVYGAGDAGEMIVRDMRYNALYDYDPIGFIDDDMR